MGAGHSFLVLEGPLSEDTHSLDPAPDKSGGPPPEFFFPFFFFFFEALFSQYFIFLPSSFLSSYSPNLLFFPRFSSFFFFTYRNPRHRRHRGYSQDEPRFLPASQASLS